MDEPAVRVRNLTKSFSGRTVVENLSFNVQKGDYRHLRRRRCENLQMGVTLWR